MTGYSTKSDRVYQLAATGPDMVRLREPEPVPLGRAVIVVEVDGRERRWEVEVVRVDGERVYYSELGG